MTEPAMPHLLRVEEAALILRVGKSATYDLIRSGVLRSIKIGRRRLIPAEAIPAAVAALLDQDAA
jgi:excisionase family DNA binding protein